MVPIENPYGLPVSLSLYFLPIFHRLDITIYWSNICVCCCFTPSPSLARSLPNGRSLGTYDVKVGFRKLESMGNLIVN